MRRRNPLNLLHGLNSLLSHPRINRTLPPIMILLTPHLPRIPPMLLKVGPKFQILGGDSILTDLGQESESDERTEKAESTGHKERILTTSCAIGATWCVRLNDGEDVGADESANFAEGGGNCVVLASDCGRGCFGRNQADIIAWSGFSEREKDAIDNDEAGYMLGGVEKPVAACHNEADDAL